MQTCKKEIQIKFKSIIDPEKRARLYFEKHQLLHVFQELVARVAAEKPNDPRQCMVSMVNQEILQRKESKNSSALPLQNSSDVVESIETDELESCNTPNPRTSTSSQGDELDKFLN